MMSQDTKLPKIILGHRVGKLEVTAPTDVRKSNYIVWRCKCDCGNECLAASTQLTQGYKKAVVV